MRYINLTQGKRAIVDDEDYELLCKHKWYYDLGYAKRNIVVGGKRNLLRMHREILNAPDGLSIDHINGDGLDNRRENLRACTTSENQRNRGEQRNGTSGFKGVSWRKKDKGWRAQLWHLGKAIWLGCYKTKEEAALAYNKKAIELHGDFAKLNVVEAVVSRTLPSTGLWRSKRWRRDETV